MAAERFPAPTYRDTVLRPLFDLTKVRFAAPMMAIHRAHGVMLAETGILQPKEAGAILGALRDIDATIDPTTLAYTGEHEDFFFTIEAALVERLGVDLAGRLHTGRSRNDMHHTMFKMVLKAELAALLADLAGLIGALLDKAFAERATIVVAYTHGQPAQPTTWGHYLAALVEMLLRDVERLELAGRHLDSCPMGAAAITSTGFAIDRARMAELLGFATVQENSYGCIAACDYIAGLYAALGVLFLGLGRFCQDLHAWTGFEVGHLRAPRAWVQISSIMPQKRNPVPIEHLRLMCSLAAGQCDAVLRAMHNTPFTDMNDSEEEVQAAGHEVFARGRRALPLLAGFVAALEVDRARVRRHLDQSCATITELADSLVRLEGVSFRQAHEVAGQLAKWVIEAGVGLEAVPFDQVQAAFHAVTDRALTLSEEKFRRIVSPEHFVAVRERPGGPGPKALAASLTGLRRALEGLGKRNRAHKEHLEAAERLLDARVAQLIGAA